MKGETNRRCDVRAAGPGEGPGGGLRARRAGHKGLSEQYGQTSLSVDELVCLTGRNACLAAAEGATP